tara:strand:- start:17 stop:676 length:660 start_codon:yes stop_codon:yes gene_type:complete
MDKTKVISFSLWGSSSKYCVGAVRNAELSQSIYPGWRCRFYIANSVPDIYIKELQQFDNVDIVQRLQESGSWESMFWRHETCWDESVSVSIFRDTDCRLNSREKCAVDQWLQSDKTFHIMRDHPFHGYHILGGMWGYKYNSKYNLKEAFEKFKPQDHYGTDYIFFRDILFPLIKDDKITHDEFFEKKPFPVKRNNNEFVGEVYDEKDIRHPDHYRYINQ